MALKEGELVLITLACGCCERRVTALHGKQVIKCPNCKKETVVIIEINRNNEVGYFKVRESYA
jgi:predicted RNA-binding Zn-ribbon protein involved in translation (DUF1610 family)